MCRKHQQLLVGQVGLKPSDPWRAHVIVAQIVLFQATSAHPSTYERLGGDLKRLGELGCLACFRPDAFGEIIQAFQRGGIAAVKALGDRIVNDKAVNPKQR